MNFLLLSGRLESIVGRLDTSLLVDQSRPSLVTYCLLDSRAPGSTKSGSLYLNREGDISEPVFPENLLIDSACGFIRISEFEVITVIVLASNQRDADLLCLQTIGKINEISK